MGWLSGKRNDADYKVLRAGPEAGIVFWVGDGGKANDINFIEKALLAEKHRWPVGLVAKIAAGENPPINIVSSPDKGYEVHIGLTGIERDVSTALAWEVLQRGAFGIGRNMLKAICWQQPRELEPNVLLIFDLLREPLNAPDALAYLDSVLHNHTGSCEAKSLQALSSGPLFQPPSNTSALHAGYEHLLAALRSTPPPRSCHASALLVAAALAMNDFIIQMKVRASVVDQMPEPVVTGMANFMLRDHKTALVAFSRGQAELDRTASNYEKHFKRELGAQQRTAICTELQNGCLLGWALTLRDMGRSAEAKAAWQRVASESQGGLEPNLTRAVEMLATE